MERVPTATHGLLDVSDATQSNEYEERPQRQLAQLELETYASRVRQNALIPINQLPPEILSAILGELQASAENLAWAPLRIPSWFFVTHVCRHWRAVALDSASLWTGIAFATSNLNLVKLVMRRSKNAPLSFDSMHMTRPLLDAVQQALSEPRRLLSVSLEIYDGDGSLCQFLARCLGPLPLLEKLHVLNLSCDHVAEFPRRFMEDGAPRMKDIKLVGFDFASKWGTLPFPRTLVRLQLRSPSNARRPTAKLFSAVLRQLPLLEYLELSDILPIGGYVNNVPFESRGIIFSFLELRRIHLEDSLPAINDFVQVSEFPRCTSLQLLTQPHLPTTTGSMARTFASVAALARGAPSHLIPHCAHLQELKLTRFRLHMPSKMDFTLAFQRRSPEYAEPRNVEISFSLSLPSSLTDCLAIASEHLGFSTLQSLVVETCSEVPKDTWRTIFAPLENLQTIHIYQSGFRTFLKVLAKDPALSGSGEAIRYSTHPIRPYFKSLETISFTSVEFKNGSKRRLGREDSVWSEHTRRASAWLVHYLRRRPPSLPQLEVRIQECNHFSLADYERLCDLTPRVRVVWDVDEQTLSDESEGEWWE